MLFGYGFGATNPFVTQTANTALVTGGGGGAASSHAGGFSLTPHTWQDVVIESNPSRGMTVQQWEAALATWRANVAATAAPLGACDPGALTDLGTSCYYGRYTPIVSWNPLDPVELLPPGVFAVYGVPFGAYEIANGKFVRTLVPTAQQRRELEWAVIRASQIRLFGHPNKQTRIDQRFLDDGSVMATLRERFGLGSGPALLPKLSVDALLELVPDVMLFSINFQRNSIQPTPDERTKEGGFYAWIARGGYPLSRGVVTGRTATDGALGLQFCGGFECACPSSGANAGFPSCMPMGFTKNGIGEAKPGEGSFHPYVTIPQDKVRSDVQLSLVHNDPAWISKVGNIGKKILDELFGVFCANQEFTKEKLGTMMKEKCMTAAGQPCTKGSPGCICTSPTSTQQASVGVFNAAMQMGCASWAKGNLPDPITNLPPVAPPPAPEPMPWYMRIPWWAVAIVGAGAGAAAFSHRSK